MGLSLRAIARRVINGALRPLDLEIRTRHAWSDQSAFMPFERTIAGARSAGLPVGEYIDTVLSGTPGVTAETITHLAGIGVFDDVDTVSEIGPGSGRYLDETLRHCSPSRYEIYESAQQWAEYIAGIHDVVVQPFTGRSLSGTPDRSVDLVHAHKVFSSVPFGVTCGYWAEMVRVVRPGGWVVFDIITDDCLPPDVIDAWIEEWDDSGSFPAIAPRRSVLEWFTRAGLTLKSSFIVPMGAGQTEVFAFRRAPA